MTTYKMSFVDILERLSCPIVGGDVFDYCCGEERYLKIQV